VRIARSTTTIVLTCLVAVGAAFACAPALAASLPPQLVAKLEADRDRAQADLKTARTRLGKAALAQREDAATAARVQHTVELVTGAAKLVGARVPADVRSDLDALSKPADAALARSDRELDRATKDAASAQAVALDSDRRLRALQRASATEDEHDTTLGSWRFGSGGPPVSAESIDDYLASKGSPMAGQGAAFLEAGVEYKIDPRFIVAISGAESYFGITTCASFNAWGWSCPSHPASFSSWEHAIKTVTKGLRENYVDDGLSTVGEIHLRYAPPDAANDPTDLNYGWADNVAKFLIEQGGDPQDIEGVLGPSA
jgi:hypothetical protein